MQLVSETVHNTTKVITVGAYAKRIACPLSIGTKIVDLEQPWKVTPTDEKLTELVMQQSGEGVAHQSINQSVSLLDVFGKRRDGTWAK